MFIAEVSEPVKKKLRTMNIAKEEDREDQEEDKYEEELAKHGETADMYQHIKEARKTFDAEVLDAATKVRVAVCEVECFCKKVYVTHTGEIVAK
jgi:hypothetical protein